MRRLLILALLVSSALLAGLAAAAERCAVMSGGLLLCDDQEEALVRREGPQYGSLFSRDGERLGWFRLQRDGSLELFDERSRRIGVVPGGRR